MQHIQGIASCSKITIGTQPSSPVLFFFKIIIIIISTEKEGITMSKEFKLEKKLFGIYSQMHIATSKNVIPLT